MSDRGVLRVRLSHAIGLKSADSNGFSDPYVKLSLNREKRTSKIVYKTLNPRWDEDFQFRGSFSQLMNDTLQVACWDHDRLSFNDHIGDGVLPLGGLAQQLEHGGRIECSVQLKDKQATPGEVFFVLSWEFDVPRAGGAPYSASFRPGQQHVAPTGYPASGGGSLHGIPSRIVATFRHFDTNRSGFLDYGELRNALAHYGMHKSVYDAAELVRQYDDNPDGKLELGEFAELIRDLESGVVRGGRTPGGATSGVPARVAAVFDEVDANRSGFLDFGELRVALRKYGIDTSDAGAARIVRAYDERPDGKLDLHEFANLVRDIEAGVGPASATVRPATTMTPSRLGGPSPLPRSLNGSVHNVPPYRPRSPAGGSYSSRYRGYGGYGGGGYGGYLGGERYTNDGLCPGGICGGGGCGSGLGGLAYLLDVVFRTMLYSVATAAMVAPERLLGEADYLARLTGKGSASELVADTPGFVWAFLLGTLLTLLLILIDCCGVRTACAQCCGERGGPGPCTRCWRALRACLLGGRGLSRRYYDGPAGNMGGGPYSRYESDVFEYTEDYSRVRRPETGYEYV